MAEGSDARRGRSRTRENSGGSVVDPNIVTPYSVLVQITDRLNQVSRRLQPETRFSELPRRLRQRCESQEKKLKDNLKKFYRARGEVELKDAQDRKLHPVAQKLKERSWQFSRDELRVMHAYKIDGQVWNAAVTFEKMVAEQAEQMQKWIETYQEFQLHLLKELSSRRSYERKLTDVVNVFFNSITDTVTTDEKASFEATVKKWGASSYVSTKSHEASSFEKDKQKKADFEKNRVENLARLQNMSSDELVVRRLLVELKIPTSVSSRDSKYKEEVGLEPCFPTFISSSSDLGIILATPTNSALLTKYNLKIEQSSSLRPILRHGSSRENGNKQPHKQPKKKNISISKPKSRSASRGSSKNSFASARSSSKGSNTSRRSGGAKSSKSSRNSSKGSDKSWGSKQSAGSKGSRGSRVSSGSRKSSVSSGTARKGKGKFRRSATPAPVFRGARRPRFKT